jgi:hypothetical protein
MVVMGNDIQYGMGSHAGRRTQIDVSRHTARKGSRCKMGEQAHGGLLPVLVCRGHFFGLVREHDGNVAIHPVPNRTGTAMEPGVVVVGNHGIAADRASQDLK